MSKIQRWLELGAVGGRLAGSFVAGRWPARATGNGDASQADRVLATTEQIVSQLSKMKGAAMKVGQQAAMMASQFDLPDEIQAALGTLHADATPVPFERIRATLEQQLDGPIGTHFASVDPTPLGTASLAQAHAATLPDGRDVVVKVLHPGVEKSVDADLVALRAMLVTGRALGRSASELNALFDELSLRIHEELDYLQEAVNLQQFAECFAGDDRYRFPVHHPAWCGERVLTMDRLYGQTIDAFAKTADADLRQLVGVRLATLFLDMTFRHRLLHADPHPGNYLVEPDGRLAVLDFGCVKRFSPFWIGRYAQMTQAALDARHDDVLACAVDLGAWTGNNPAAGKLVIDFCETVVAPFRGGARYEIGGPDDDVVERVGPMIVQIFRSKEIVAPRDVLFLHRTLGGMYTLARKLRPTAPWGDLLRPHLDEAIAAAQAPKVA